MYYKHLDISPTADSSDGYFTIIDCYKLQFGELNERVVCLYYYENETKPIDFTQEWSTMFASIPINLTKLALSSEQLLWYNGVCSLDSVSIKAPIIKLKLFDLGLEATNDKIKTLIPDLSYLPHSIKTLLLSFKKSDSITPEFLITFCKTIPANITSLILEISNFNTKTNINATLDLLKTFFAAIPKNITSLRFKSNNSYRNTLSDFLQQLETTSLETLFQSIPQHIITFKLKSNELGFLDYNELKALISSLPTTLQSLDLSNNNLDEFNFQELAEILNILPTQLKKLNLQDNNIFNDKPIQLLTNFLTSFPKQLTSLNLYGNCFCYMQADTHEIQEAFNKMPPMISSLNISENYNDDPDEPNSISLKEMITITTSSKITTLDFSGTDFNQYTTIKKFRYEYLNLSPSFAAIPTSVTSLNLSKLHHFTSTYLDNQVGMINLIQAFLSIKAPIKILNLSQNALGRCSANYVTLISLSKLPDNELNHFILCLIWVKQENRLYYINSDQKVDVFTILEPTFNNALENILNSYEQKHYIKPHKLKNLSDEDCYYIYINLREPLLDKYLLSNNATKILKILRKVIKETNVGHLPFNNKSTLLVPICRCIPPSVILLKLHNNLLHLLTIEELIAVLAAIPKTVLQIDLRHNQLFYDKSIQQRDQLLLRLNQLNNEPKHDSWSYLVDNSRFIISHNGEATFARALLPLLSSVKQGQLCFDIACRILSYLLPPSKKGFDVESNDKNESSVMIRERIKASVLADGATLLVKSFFRHRQKRPEFLPLKDDSIYSKYFPMIDAQVEPQRVLNPRAFFATLQEQAYSKKANYNQHDDIETPEKKTLRHFCLL